MDEDETPSSSSPRIELCRRSARRRVCVMGNPGAQLISPQELAGTFYVCSAGNRTPWPSMSCSCSHVPRSIFSFDQGNGCICSPGCIRLEVSPACCGGICVLQYCDGCPVPLTCQFMMPCCGKCYTDCDDEGYWTPDKDHLDAKCGRGFVRAGTGGPENATMDR